MKLLMITGDRSLAEGKRGAFYNTLEEFHKYWERIDIICPKISRGSTSGGFEVEPLFGEPLFGNVYFHSSSWPLVMQSWWILKKGHELYCEHKFNLMTVHEYPPFYNGIGARLLWNRLRVPYVLEIHHIPGYPKAADLKEKLYRLAMRWFIKYDAAKARAVRVVNQRQVPEFLIKAGVPKEKIVYIPSFYIDLWVFSPMNIAKEYDLIFVGRLAENKGVGLLLQAVSDIKTQMPNIRLLIVGQGPELNRLKLQTKNYKLETNVTFWGWAKDSQEVAGLINKSRILIMPSYNEGGPRVVLEAMACGVPVLATPVGIVPDIIGNGEPHTKWGRAASPRDFVRGGSGGIIDWNPVDISKKAVELLGNASQYQKYRENGLEIAKNFEKRVAIKNYAQKLINLSR